MSRISKYEDTRGLIYLSISSKNFPRPPLKKNWGSRVNNEFHQRNTPQFNLREDHITKIPHKHTTYTIRYHIYHGQITHKIQEDIICIEQLKCRKTMCLVRFLYLPRIRIISGLLLKGVGRKSGQTRSAVRSSKKRKINSTSDDSCVGHEKLYSLQ